ncbi:MAG: hypothetical protein KUA30_04175 [Candidatus Desulforudis sp.]|nr:hypothetical protein [Desulforudis sp.]
MIHFVFPYLTDQILVSMIQRLIASYMVIKNASPEFVGTVQAYRPYSIRNRTAKQGHLRQLHWLSPLW